MNRSLFRAAAWTLAAVAATLALLAVPASSPSQAASFTLSDANCSSFGLTDNGGGNFTLNCNTSGGTFGCSISTSNSAPTLATAVTLTANCPGAVGGVSYTWSGPGASPAGCPAITPQANPVKADLAIPTSTTALSNCGYTLSANDNATTANANKNVSYTTSGGGSGGGGGTDTTACTAQGLTPNVISIPWANQSVYTANNGGFGANTALVIKFTTPASIPAGTGMGKITAAEYNSSPSARTGSLSPNPCEFGLPGTLAGGGFANTQAPSIYFKLPGSTKSALQLEANTTYYFNIRNDPGSTCSSNGSCDMLITMSKTSGS